MIYCPNIFTITFAEIPMILSDLGVMLPEGFPGSENIAKLNLAKI